MLDMIRGLWDEFEELIHMLAVIAVALTALLCCIGGATFIGDKTACTGYARNAEVETKFEKTGVFSWECYVNVDGNWIPADKWRGVSE